MRVEWAIPCRYTEVHDNLATIVGGGIDHLWPSRLPAPVALWVAIRIVFLPDEIDDEEPHKLRVAAMGPDGAKLADVEGPLSFGGPSAPPAADRVHGVLMPMLVQFPATIEGEHRLEVTLDGVTTALPLNIAPGPPPLPPQRD